jgi:hypothetical protein
MVKEAEPHSEDVVYRETIYFGIWLWTMVLGLVGLYIAVAIGAIAKHMSWWYIVFFAIALFVVVLLINFWRLVFIITETRVTFGFGVIKKSFKRSDVISCQPYKLKFSNYLGYGIRVGLDKTVAYNTRNGDGVKMVFQGAKRPYVVSVNNSGYVCNLLSRQGNNGRSGQFTYPGKRR